MFKYIEPGMDKLWYNDIQRSFLEALKDRNLTLRYNRQFQKWEERCVNIWQKRPWTVSQNSSVKDLRERFKCIHDTFANTDSRQDAESDDESVFKSDKIGDVLYDIPNSLSDMSISEIPDTPITLMYRIDDQMIVGLKY